MQGITAELDERDAEILASRLAQFNQKPGPRDGDYVIFADDITRRISHVWKFEPFSVQTSDGGSWYLGNGYTNFSGSLFGGVPADSLVLTDETRDGVVWFFHHDHWQAHNGIDTVIPFRVYRCSLNAPS